MREDRKGVRARRGGSGGAGRGREGEGVDTGEEEKEGTKEGRMVKKMKQSPLSQP